MSRAGILILAFAALSLLPQFAPQNFPADDALFYMQVARNIAAGHGSTFNTITPTNGYHPLWMAICVPIAAIAHGDRMLQLRMAFAVQGLLSLIVLLILWRLLARICPTGWIVGLAVVAPYFLTGMYGSEAHLNGALLMVACAAMLTAAEEPSARSFALLGAALGLAVLARLDDVFVAGAMLVTASVALRGPWSRRVGRFLTAILAGGAIGIPYLEYNLRNCGGALPISGAIKSTFPHINGRIANLGSLGLIVALGAICGLAFAGTKRSLAPRLRRLLLALGAGTLLHALYVVLFTNHRTHWSWYYVPGVVHLGVLIAACWQQTMGRFATRTQIRLASTVAGFLLVAAFARGAARVVNPQAVGNNQLHLELSRGETRWTVSLSRWLDQRLPHGAGMMVYDYPGALAYYSSIRILPEDGLIGDYGYNRDLVIEGASEYLRAHQVNYYMGPFGSDGYGAVEVFAPLGHRSAGLIQLHRENLIVRVRDLPHMTGAPDLGVWRLRP